MLYLIGLGLNSKGYSREAYEAISNADRVYVDTYTIEFPYDFSDITSQFRNKNFINVGREFVEGLGFLKEAKDKDIVLLVYGSPLVATTHSVIIKEAMEKKIKIKIFHAGSILDAVAETGLQPYKFGKTTSIPSFEADSYAGIIKNNLKIKAHSLVLADIGLSFDNALKKLDGDCSKNGVKLDKIVVCERLGLKNSHIYYNRIKSLKFLKVKAPFCFVVPGELHFVEKEFLNSI